MIIFEIENHETGVKGQCCAANTEEMHAVLIEKGFDCVRKYEWYAAINDKGEEISAMPFVCANIRCLLPIKKAGQL